LDPASQHARLTRHDDRIAKVPEPPLSDCKQGEAKNAISGAIETITSRNEPVNSESQKKKGFERKYDMSIPGNIYISSPLTSEAGENAGFSALTPLYKAIYWTVSESAASRSPIEVRRVEGVVTV
jgi:hypothetical protein